MNKQFTKYGIEIVNVGMKRYLVSLVSYNHNDIALYTDPHG